MIIFLTGPTCVGKSTYTKNKSTNPEILVIELDSLYRRLGNLPALANEVNRMINLALPDKKHILLAGAHLMLPGVIESIMKNSLLNTLKTPMLIILGKSGFKNLFFLYNRVKTVKPVRLIIEKIILYLFSRLIYPFIPLRLMRLKKIHKVPFRIIKKDLSINSLGVRAEPCSALGAR